MYKMTEEINGNYISRLENAKTPLPAALAIAAILSGGVRDSADDHDTTMTACIRARAPRRSNTTSPE